MKVSFDIVNTGFTASIRRHIAKWCVGLGISLGSNSYLYGRPNNFFIEVDFLFWRLGFEITWKNKLKLIKADFGPNASKTYKDNLFED